VEAEAYEKMIAVMLCYRKHKRLSQFKGGEVK